MVMSAASEGGLGFASGVEVALGGVVLPEGLVAVPVTAKVVEHTIDALLKSTVLAWPRGEVFHRVAAGSLARHSEGADGSQRVFSDESLNFRATAIRLLSINAWGV
jgi:hypothetical protein